jgi:hypothetical protein
VNARRLKFLVLLIAPVIITAKGNLGTYEREHQQRTPGDVGD